MPYFFVLAAFALISVAGAAGIAIAWLYRPLRPLFPFVWRAWLGALVGFVFANALLLATFWTALSLSAALGRNHGSKNL